MATLYDTSATKALNEDAYINKLYDGTLDSQKKALQQGYDDSVKQLTTGQQNTQKQTSDYVKRAYVEGQRASGHVQKPATYPGLGNGGANAQARLTMGNQQQRNVSTLNNQQAVADQEFERQRKVLADKYAAQIKQAQADNDMVRAQALYDAAKAEEEQLRTLRESAASLMAGKGDMSITNAIAQGAEVTPDTTSPTWDGVLKNEESINKIYDAEMESLRQQAQMEHDESMSELEAQQKEAQRQTDEALNNAYVEALKKNQNYQEVQNAYGQGSGASMQARLAREAGLTEKLTDLRKLQLGKDAKTEMDKADLVRALGETISKAQSDVDSKRNKELYEAAEDEEQALIEEQKTVGNILAKQNNYSVLGALYGLTPDQIHRLQGTGAYAPVYQGGGGGGGGGYRYSGGGSDDDTSGSGTSKPVNMTIATNVGPYSDETIANMVQSGQVNYNPVTKVYTKNESYGHLPAYTAMVNSQKAQASGNAVMANSSKSSSSSGNIVAKKVVDAVKPVVDAVSRFKK